jgi:hypothetical protein
MGDFKFFGKNEDAFERIFDEAERLEAELAREREATAVPLSVDNRPAVFLNLSRNRDTISDEEWNSIITRQRHVLIDYMWTQGMVTTEIISQDENGFTLRTEINL